MFSESPAYITRRQHILMSSMNMQSFDDAESSFSIPVCSAK